MPAGASRPACPFIAGPKIDDPRCFVGRREELRLLAARMSGSQPVSINVTGERRIGKSSLLCQFWRTWEQRVDAPARFAVFYADLQEADPASEDAFFQLLAKTLLTRPALHRDSDINAALSKSPFTRQDFAAALDLLAGRSLLPVFCLDEFEMLLKRKEQFGDPFFDHLRGLMNANRLMFIFASREPVDVYAKEQQLTSGFFNLGHLLRLGEFSEAEADELVNLPDRNNPALDAEERRLARKWGGRHPYLLQLAALSLFEAKRDGKNTVWAKRRFKAQLEQATLNSIWNRPLGLVLRSCRKLLDPLAEDSEKCRKVLLNIVLPLLGIPAALLLLGLWLAGWLSSDKLLELAKKLWGLL